MVPATGPLLRRRLLLAALIALAVLLPSRAGDDLSPLRRLELLTLDWRFRLRGPVPPGPEIVLVMIDDRSVGALGQWPPSRDVLADALARAAEAGPRLVVLNLMLAQPAPVLPQAARDVLTAALPLLPPTAAVHAGIEALLDQDRADEELGAAIAAGGQVVLPYAFVFDAGSANTAGVPPWVAETAYPTWVQPPASASPDLGARGVLSLAPELATLGAAQGHVTLLVDEDGALRFDLPAFPYGEALYPSLAVEAARLFHGLPRDEVVPWLGQGLAFGADWLPLDARSRLLVDHYGPEGSFPTLSFIDLLAGRIDPGLLQGRIVVIGASAAGTGDRFITPFTSRLPGSEHLAAAIDNLLHGKALRRDGPVRLIDGLALLGLALATGLLAGRRSLLLSVLVTLAAMAAWAAVAIAAFWHGVWLEIVSPALAALLVGSAMELLRAGGEQRRRRGLEQQRGNLARYFPPAVVDRLAASERPSALDRTQDAAVLFVDMVGFTRVSEGLTPAAAMELLRAFHRRVERAVFAHGGTVDKFMGDGALACFGLPDPSPSAAADAVRAAREILAGVLAWSHELEAVGHRPVRVGIGIHIGPVLMGDIGGERQFQFTVIGDTVNVASRLQDLTRQLDAAIVISDAVAEAVRAAGESDLLAGFEPLPLQPLRGREGRLALWRFPAPRLDPPARCEEPALSSSGD